MLHVCVCEDGEFISSFTRWYLHPRCISFQPTSLTNGNRAIFFFGLHWKLSIIHILSLSTLSSVFSVSVWTFLCVCILAQIYGCAQTTLCVNTSLVVGVGASTPVCVGVCVYVRVDWWGRSRGPGLLTTSCLLVCLLSCSSLPTASVPSLFNLAAEAMGSGSVSHQGTRLVFKGHAHASFCLLSSPCLFTLSWLFSPPCSLVSSSPHFCLLFNFLHLPHLCLAQ